MTPDNMLLSSYNRALFGHPQRRSFLLQIGKYAQRGWQRQFLKHTIIKGMSPLNSSIQNTWNPVREEKKIIRTSRVGGHPENEVI